MACSTLLDLPPEIILVLLAHLGYVSLLKCRQVSPIQLSFFNSSFPTAGVPYFAGPRG